MIFCIDTNGEIEPPFIEHARDAFFSHDFVVVTWTIKRFRWERRFIFFYCIRSWSQSLMTLKYLLLPVDAKQQLSGRRDSFILGFFFSLIVKLWPQFIPNGIYSKLNNSHSLSDPYLAFLRFFLDFNVLTRFQRIIRKRVHVENWQPCVTYYTLTLDIAYRVELKE